jgi:hypothetical protein
MSRNPVHPYWGIVEISGFAILFFAGNWLMGPSIANSLLLVLLFWVLFIAGTFYLLWISPVKLHGIRWKEWGWNISLSDDSHPGSLRNAFPTYLAITCIVSTIFILYVILITPETLERANLQAVAVKFGGYLFFGTAQSILFFGFIMIRLKNVISRKLEFGRANLQLFSTVFLTAAIFSIFHLPNTPLMGITFLGGLIWAWLFYEKPNILLMGVSHAIIGTILSQVVQMHTRIGPFYNNPDHYFLREVVPGLKQLIGDLF